VLDEVMIKGLHVEFLRGRDVHAEHEPHILFQASTVGALLDGAYDGDATFAELAEQGDLGIGTVNGLDGEMIALDGRFFRADLDGAIHEIEASSCTPFAVVDWFEPTVEFELERATGNDELLAEVERHAPPGAVVLTLRVDGHFDLVKARSVPKQEPPYRPLAAVVADQHVFALTDVEGSLVGFRFPDYSQGIEVTGYHLHFITADRARGGHVLECRPRHGRVRLDPSADLHVELPQGVDIAAPDLSEATRTALARVEGAR
jgi:acetolactate decarboxylase